MCGIFAIICGSNGQVNLQRGNCCGDNKSLSLSKSSSPCKTVRELAYQHSGRQRHRGPDYTGVVDWSAEDGVTMVHERLAILGVRHGNQPFESTDGNLLLIVNGEIYNYLEVTDTIIRRRDQIYKPRSDSDVIMALYEEFGLSLMEHISGMFAFVLYDRQRKRFVAARDPIGIIPLYWGNDDQDNLYFASEMKCLVGLCDNVENFEPGVLAHGTPGNVTIERFFNPEWMTTIPNEPNNKELLRRSLEDAVRTHLQCDVPYGALLSGGLDSSLIASIATKMRRETDLNYRLKTYSVGLENAPDLKYARMVADFIGSDHQEVHFTVEEGLDCIRDIIFHVESYDVTTIRSSIPMFILSRFVKSEGLKMVLSGEGADEIFGGYLYFHAAPSAAEFHKETVSRVRCLHFSDCLRANKATMSWGVELRVPFLSDFLNHAMAIRPTDRMAVPRSKTNGISPATNNVLDEQNSRRAMEKFILREAFADGDYLPEEVLWRQKEQFSDGVGYQWIDQIKDYAASHVTDEEFMAAAKHFPLNTPATREAYFYRKVFDDLFPGESFAKTVMKWIPRTDWGCSADPSGRAQAAHISAGGGGGGEE